MGYEKQQDLADAWGEASKFDISRWESGAREIPLPRLVALARFYQIDPRLLLSDPDRVTDEGLLPLVAEEMRPHFLALMARWLSKSVTRKK